MSVPGGLCAMMLGGTSGLDVPLSFGNAEDLETTPTNALAQITFNTNGTVTLVGNVSSPIKARWFIGTPTTCYVRRVISVGTLSTDPGSGWLSLASARTFDVTYTSDAAGSTQCVLAFEFSYDGSTVAATSASSSLLASVESGL